MYYCVLLNIALFLSVGLLRPHVSGMTLCWPFNPHYGKLSYVFKLLLLMWIDELNKWNKWNVTYPNKDCCILIHFITMRRLCRRQLFLIWNIIVFCRLYIDMHAVSYVFTNGDDICLHQSVTSAESCDTQTRAVTMLIICN